MPRRTSGQTGAEQAGDVGMEMGDTARSGQTQGSQAGQQGDQGSPHEGMLDAAKDKVRQLGSQAQETVSEQVDSGLSRVKSSVASTLSSVAQSLRSSSQDLNQRNESTVARYTDRAANRVDRLAEYLRQADVGEMSSQAEDFARREPVLFLGAMFTIGLVGARFLKSSQRNQGGSSWQARPGRSQRGEYRGAQWRGAARPSYADREVTRQRSQGDWAGTQPNESDRMRRAAGSEGGRSDVGQA